LERIDREIARGAAQEAIALLRQHYEARPTLVTAAQVSQRVDKLGAQSGLSACRLFVLRSFTVEPLLPLLRAEAQLHGLALATAIGEFNAWQQEILDPASALHAHKPDVVLLALQGRDLSPALWAQGGELTQGQAQGLAQAALDELGERLQQLRARSDAQIAVLDFVPPTWPAQGFLDAQGVHAPGAAVAHLNLGLRKLAAELRGVYVIDHAGPAARFGHDRWFDERRWLTTRLPFSAAAQPLFVHEVIRALVALRGKTRKCLVVDLDNTLWGGVVGEDGPAGIKLSKEYPGAAFRALQQVLRDLAARGVLLAIASKNNLADAMEVLEKHAEMLLRPKDFAAVRINWNDKSQSLRELAAELNIGLDSLVFLDDNPIERERVRTEVPEVAVLELPAEPMEYAAFLRNVAWFERPALTSEDRARTQQYAEQRERALLEATAGSVEEFLRSLSMSMQARRPDDKTLARVAQLTQKTNQFNLTTRRRSEEELRAFERAGGEVWHYAVQDRFGDNGIIGVALLERRGDVAELDTLLMSCRVIGRTVETAMLAHLAQRARALGAKTLSGWFIPTAKNAPGKDFFAAHGFTVAETRGADARWELPLTGEPLAVPPCFAFDGEG
ncbi:MAG: HAD family hydrolase, partial [Deltaproteobacteria bacterium]|nr:HAD family hydrolase [Deltaproteobacteria bacterium]